MSGNEHDTSARNIPIIGTNADPVYIVMPTAESHLHSGKELQINRLSGLGIYRTSLGEDTGVKSVSQLLLITDKPGRIVKSRGL